MAHGFLVQSADSEQTAKGLLAVTTIDILLSNMSLTNGDGLELVRFTKASTKSKIILMTSFGEILETQRAFELGTDQFLTKPFKIEDLQKAIQNCLRPKYSDSADQEYQFCQVLLEDLSAATILPADIFVRLSKNNFVKISNRGTTILKERILSYKDKGVTHLYIRREDFGRYVGIHLLPPEGLSPVPESVRLRRRLVLAKCLTEELFAQLHTVGFAPEQLDDAFSLVTNVVNYIDGVPDLSLLMDETMVFQDLATHSLCVSAISCLIAREIGWASTATFFKITMAGLFHDIGEREIPQKIVQRPRHELSSTELKILEFHTLRGHGILASISNMPEDVALVALQHHENMNGTGFPNNLKREQIHPLARIIAVADRLCEIVLSQHSSKNPLRKATEILENEFGSELEPLFLRALSQILRGKMHKQFQAAS